MPHLDHPITAKSSRKFYNMYEGQISVSVSRIDRSRWTAWAFVDGWFPGSETVNLYRQESGGDGRPDPLTAGQFLIETPEPDPRAYFLRVVEIRIQQVEKESDKILQAYREEIQRYIRLRV